MICEYRLVMLGGLVGGREGRLECGSEGASLMVLCMEVGGGREKTGGRW